MLRVLLIICVSTILLGKAEIAQTNEEPRRYLTTSTPTILFSVNDGEAGALVMGDGEPVQDSVSVVRLSSDAPPEIKTVYGGAHSSLLGSPHAAVVGGFGIVTNHNIRLDEQRQFVEKNGVHEGRNQIAVIDLTSMKVTDIEYLDAIPWLAHTHSDDRRVIVGLSNGWLVASLSEEGKLTELTRSDYQYPIASFDLSPDGEQILAVVGSPSETQWLARFTVDGDIITVDGNTDAQEFLVEGPFSPRIYPQGDRALVLNSGGLSDGVLDDVMIVDMRKNKVIGRIPQVSDGLESIAIHPSGRFAVISCLNAMPWSTTSHIAVIDLEGQSPRLAYSLPVEPIPEGIEFSKDGSQLFLGSTLANHISVYSVEDMNLILQPFVLGIGEGHAALGISFPLAD